MRGKKSDPEFIAEFIALCIKSGKQTTQDIVNHAKELVSEIDEQIKSIEAKKSTRSKLLDVINSFDKPKVNIAEIKALPLFSLDYNNCKRICERVKDGPISVSDISLDDKFFVKQMLEYKVLAKYENYILAGERYSEYINLGEK